MNHDFLNSMEKLRNTQGAENKVEISSAIDEFISLVDKKNIKQRLEEEFERSKRLNQPLTIMMMELDKNKGIEHMYDQKIGDKILNDFLLTLNDSIRRYDLICRYKEEKVLLIFPNLNQKKSRIVAKRIGKNILQNNFSLCEEPIHLTISIGIFTFVRKKRIKLTIEDFINKVDKALYCAKNKGGGCAVNYTSRLDGSSFL